MSNNYQKDFDTLKNEMLTDYQNLDSAPDISQGSPVNIKVTVLAAAIWSLYKYNDWIDKQRMPGDQADSDQLDRWGTIFGIPRLIAETDSAYAARMAAVFQQPPAGGTKQDFENWALTAVPSPGIAANLAEQFLPASVSTSLDHILLDGTQNALGWVNTDPIEFTTTGTLPAPLVEGTQYYARRQDTTAVQVATSAGGDALDITTQGSGIHQIAHYPQTAPDPNNFYISGVTVITPNSITAPTQPGSVTVVLVPNDESILDPSNLYYPAVASLAKTASDYIDARRPVTGGVNSVSLETTTTYAVTMTVSPITAPVFQIQTDIISYVNALSPGSILYRSQLEAVALRDGAVNATVTYPVFDINGQIIPDSTSAIRTSTVTINVTA